MMRGEINEMYAAERDEQRSARRSMTEMDRVRACDWPQRPCSCGTCGGLP